jgi:hypothetical protein
VDVSGVLTAHQRKRCAEIVRLLDAGDQSEWLRAEPTLTREERGLILDLRLESHAARRGAGARPAAPPKVDDDEPEPIDDLGPQPEDMPDDLDDDDEEEERNEDDEE